MTETHLAICRQMGVDGEPANSSLSMEGMSAVSSKTFLAKHLPLPADNGEVVAGESDPMNVDAEPILSRSQSPALSKTEVPMVNSLQSSTSSTSTSFPVCPTHSRQQSIPTLKKVTAKLTRPQPQVPLAEPSLIDLLAAVPTAR
ncbi:hypothetical protein BT96DRAFT_1003151 [Gymnopus androsaceus JB14]|uniref:Uncharacterized protein n=1 Tax=Gymnopus androsaceus JB14 TaxID=1447944 RepID=A0A6A4GUL5_9AGAR|nr:hypothetical protein BT96DRAFT_1003151 [Gymnopus androsaceus JB14]